MRMPHKKSSLSLCVAFLLSALSLSTLYGCRPLETMQPDTVEQVDAVAQTQQTDRVMIRVANKSDWLIDDIVIDFSASDNGVDFAYQTEAYGSLAPADMSPYHHINSSFRYAPMEVSIGDEKIQQGVTDFVGEVPIPNGNYTYELTYGPVEGSQGKAVLESYLVYDQTALDRAIARTIDAEITAAIAKAYYPDEALIHWFDCVHQQTHRGGIKGTISGTSEIVVYAKFVCSEPSSEPHPNKRLEGISPLPIRIELAKKEDSFSVVNYQFPADSSNREDELKEIFSPQAIAEINAAPIEKETYNRLRLKVGINNDIREY